MELFSIASFFTVEKVVPEDGTIANNPSDVTITCDI
jgi:hypothetical protein